MAVIDVGPVLAGSDLPVPFMASNGTTPVNNAKQIRRNLLAAVLAPGAAEQTVRDGVLARLWGTGAEGVKYTSLSLLQGASPSQYVVPFPGTAVISRSGQGPYLIMQTTSPQIPLGLADGTNPRYDLIYIRLYDAKLGDPTYHGFQWCIVTGNPQASPTIPPLPAVDGVIPIGAILRPAGVNTVANSQITDLRKGTALAGGIRPMLPGDLLTDAGIFHGERRMRITPSTLTALGVPPLLTDWWDAVNAKWHGTQSFTLSSRVTAPGVISPGGTRTGASIVIPDPGWAYKVSGSATARCTGAGSINANELSMQVRVGVNASATVYDGTIVAAGTCPGTSTNAYIQAEYATADNVFTGSQTVYKLVKNASTTITPSLAGSDEVFDKFSITVDPA